MLVSSYSFFFDSSCVINFFFKFYAIYLFKSKIGNVEHKVFYRRHVTSTLWLGVAVITCEAMSVSFKHDTDVGDDKRRRRTKRRLCRRPMTTTTKSALAIFINFAWLYSKLYE